MRVERQYAVVEATSLMVAGSLADEPVEERQSVIGRQALGMPLYAQDALVLGALDGLDDAIGSLGRYPEVGAGVRDGLMVKGVDIER